MGDVGKKLHTARSRNDQVGTDVRLYLRAKIEAIQTQLQEFQMALVHIAENHVETLIPGYTHLQRAQPPESGSPSAGLCRYGPAGSGAPTGCIASGQHFPPGVWCPGRKRPFPLTATTRPNCWGFERIYGNSLDRG